MLVGLLALTGACGGGSSSSEDDGATPVANRTPTAQLTVSNGDGFAPLTVTFDASGSSDPDGSITSYRWDYGDGTQETAGATTSHTYQDTGVFTVSVQVTDDDGATGSISRTVRSRGATVSGTVRIAPQSSVDSDVNDRLTAPQPNNSFGEAQAVGNPLRLGGFVNQPETGSETGNFRVSGDPDDYFAVDLTGTERIVLSIGDPSADLDLELYSSDSPPALLDASVSGDATEDVPAPATPGRYFVRVLAVSGASNYVLSIDDDLVVTGLPRRAKRLSDPFVAGELLLASGSGPAARYRLSPQPGGVRLERFDRASAESAELVLGEARLPAAATATPALLARHRTLQAAKQAAARGDLAIAEVNVLRQPLRTPNDAFYDAQWHYRNIDLEQAWEISTGQATGNPDVVVAVIDTGVLINHPDLQDQLLTSGGQVVGFDFIQDPGRANDGDGLDPNPDDPGDKSRADGRGSFHGTHVAGTVAAESDNGIGVAGVSWGARLMPLRALGVDGGTTFDVMQALRYAARLNNVSGTLPPVRADVVNMSLGSDFYSEAEQRTINEVRAQGVFVVASAGNGADDVPSYPASYDGVVSVSATTITGARAPYSSFGPTVDVAAPGGDLSNPLDLSGDGRPDGVASTLGDGGGGADVDFVYDQLQGTSMAAPHVAGVIALMKSVYPDLTPAEFDTLLADGQLTDECGAPGRDDACGWGEINANKALQAALAAQSSGGGIGAILSVSAGTLNFQAFTEALDFSVTNLGDENVNVTVSDDRPWLSVSPLSSAPDGLGPYRAVVDRSGLADGTYGAVITIQPDDPSVTVRTINVIMLVTSPDPDANAGQHYVLLVPPDGDTALEVQVVTAENGEYTFALTDVPPGDYQLYAGTDLDDDDIICDGGEACGAYPNLSSPEIISVDARVEPELSDRSFASEFRTTATTTAAAGAAAQQAEPEPGVALRKP